ncbi:MAG: hypothetical protein M3R52_10510 [Acidobacteriota bacterium]|nr:hypothetical protein [Acidobacteriota bacterium]
MLNHKVFTYLFVGASVVLVVSLVVFFSGRGLAKQNAQQGATMNNRARSESTDKERDDAATPIVDLNSSALSRDRALKNARYDRRPYVKAELEPGVAEVLAERPIGVSDIPTDRSDLVVEGNVTDSAAFLSNDKGMVYSEFFIHITAVLKSASGLGITAGNLIVAERLGGRVRYSDGRIIRYRLAGQGSPEKGKKYLFFLSESGQGNYEILTAYELDGNRVFALDGSRIDYRGLGTSVFDKHNQEDYQKFRNAVETAIRNPRSGEIRRSAP